MLAVFSPRRRIPRVEGVAFERARLERRKRGHPEFADHARKYLAIDATIHGRGRRSIIAEPLVATVNVTVGPNPGTQSLVFVATQTDSLYAFNATTGQLAWHTNFLTPSAGGAVPV